MSYRFASGEVSVDADHHLFCLHLLHPLMLAVYEQTQVKESLNRKIFKLACKLLVIFSCFYVLFIPIVIIYFKS